MLSYVTAAPACATSYVRIIDPVRTRITVWYCAVWSWITAVTPTASSPSDVMVAPLVR